MRDLEFIHRFVPAPADASGRTLLLLHGTGGNENDLLPLGRELDHSAALLSPRGKILENGMPRFFRRLAEGVFDEEDVVRRANELADFIGDAAKRYKFNQEQLVAVGFSNGANIAAAMLLLRPEAILTAVLFRAMVPLIPAKPPNLAQVRVFISAGEHDPIVPKENIDQLGKLLQEAGAKVTLRFEVAGHGLSEGDVEAAKVWLAG